MDQSMSCVSKYLHFVFIYSVIVVTFILYIQKSSPAAYCH